HKLSVPVRYGFNLRRRFFYNRFRLRVQFRDYLCIPRLCWWFNLRQDVSLPKPLTTFYDMVEQFLVEIYLVIPDAAIIPKHRRNTDKIGLSAAAACHSLQQIVSRYFVSAFFSPLGK